MEGFGGKAAVVVPSGDGVTLTIAHEYGLSLVSIHSRRSPVLIKHQWESLTAACRAPGSEIIYVADLGTISAFHSGAFHAVVETRNLVTALALSEKADLLASAECDGTVRVWRRPRWRQCSSRKLKSVPIEMRFVGSEERLRDIPKSCG
jgi:hypothetical protein